jgi:hypothetical protein
MRTTYSTSWMYIHEEISNGKTDGRTGDTRLSGDFRLDVNTLPKRLEFCDDALELSGDDDDAELKTRENTRQAFNQS